MPHRGDGPIPAKVMLVGEAWGADEDREGRPFVGAAGMEVNRMLQEVGLLRSEIFVSNVVNHRPFNNELQNWIAFTKNAVTKEHVDWRGWKVKPIVVEGYNNLMTEINLVQPNVIIATGNLALHALVEGCVKMGKNGPSGIMKWRGSHLRQDRTEGLPKVIPTIHPAAVLRGWSYRSDVLSDLRRVKKHMESRVYTPPAWRFILRPSLSQVISTIHELTQQVAAGPLWLDLDLETKGRFIDCCGISWSKLDAICIPFMDDANISGYWTVEEETQIIFLLYKLLTHPNARIRWQNGLYDAQYIYDNWHFIPRGAQDTMISHHSIYSDKPKALHYQASIYCDWYVYWKDEGKHRNKGTPQEKHWAYNCQDCVYTREVGEVELLAADKLGLKQVHDWQQEMFWPVLAAMNRGLRVSMENRTRLAEEVQDQISAREEFVKDVIGFPLNPDSPKQMMAFFYDDMGQPPIMTRAKKGQPSHRTCDDDALTKIGVREPLLKPITNAIQDMRTLGKYMDVILMKLDYDGRARCSYNIGGSESGKSAPKTYRLSSSKNARGSGTNMQNISSEKSKSVGKAMQRGNIAMLGDPYSLPNVRSLFIPDDGFEFFNSDLDRADLQVVVWEADDAMLKAALHMGADIHLLNAFVLEGKEPPPLEELVETHPKYWDHRSPKKHLREFAKVFCHGTNYLGKSRTMAQHTGRTVHEIDRAQRIWFGAHPGIQRWHERTIEQVKRHRFVENKFGYRWYIFDRIDDQIMPEAVAWIPQSTVSIVINKIWKNIYDNAPWIEVLLQVHDSLGGQYPKYRHEEALIKLKENSNVVIPYEDPLVIPTSTSTSLVSWGDC